MRLSVPYYAQSSEFSCGPACILMVMKHLDPSTRLTRALEFEVWRQCNMIGIRGADPFGLCVPLLDAGYEVCLTSRRRRAVAPAAWRRHLAQSGFDPEEVRMARFGMQENRRRALARGLTVKHEAPSVARIQARIREGFVPIALVHMGVVHRLDIPHWVVVTEVAEGHVVFNDPYRPHGHKGIRLDPDTFQRILDDVEARIGMSPAAVFARARSLSDKSVVMKSRGKTKFMKYRPPKIRKVVLENKKPLVVNRIEGGAGRTQRVPGSP